MEKGLPQHVKEEMDRMQHEIFPIWDSNSHHELDSIDPAASWALGDTDSTASHLHEKNIQSKKTSSFQINNAKIFAFKGATAMEAPIKIQILADFRILNFV